MRRGVLLVLVLAVLASACAGSGYRYVTSHKTHTFLKVPDHWTVFDKEAVLANPGEIPGIADKSDDFLVRFDADPKPSVKHSFLDGDYPYGMVRVRPLAVDEHDTYSLAMLRNEVLPVDALLEQDPTSVEVLSAPKLVTHGGLRGTQLEYSVHVTTESETLSFTVMQAGFVDTPTQEVWFLLVGCSTACYQRHKGEIHRVVDSWTVEED